MGFEKIAIKNKYFVSKGMKLKIIFGFAAVIMSALAFSSVTNAATLYFSPDAENLGIGADFKVDVKIDTQNISANAVQATIKFSPSVINLLDFDKSNSVFNFWLQEPAISAQDGTIVFTAGTAKGISGSALQVINLHFKTVGAGTSQISATDAAVTASDGSGTNILSSIKNAAVGVETRILAPATSVAEVPQKVVRPAVAATGLPAKPQLRVPLYPDQSRWYSQVGNAIALWDIPPDVTGVSARLTRNNQDAKIGTPETDLFNGKDFGILNEGIWYIRVQFKNSIGWGEPVYYKISLDTTAPIPFDVKIDSVASDNPSPLVSYETNDSLSGISQYAVLIDNKEIAMTASTSLKLPPQTPGQHTIVVRAYDLAGNSIEGSLSFQILPLELPVITYFSNSVAAGEPILISGKASSPYVKIILADSRNKESFSAVADADALGNWSANIGAPLPQGIYNLTAIAKDDRGASSYSTKPDQIRIRPQAIFTIGVFDIGWFEIFLILLIIVMAVSGFGYWYYLKNSRKRSAYCIIAGRDIQKIGALMEEQIGKIENWQKRQEDLGKDSVEIKNIVDRMKDIVDKMKKYLGEELEKIK